MKRIGKHKGEEMKEFLWSTTKHSRIYAYYMDVSHGYMLNFGKYVVVDIRPIVVL